MPRYIDANALQSNMMEMVASGLYGLEDMIDAVIEAPTVSPDEVRGVVHCSECSHADKDLPGAIYCTMWDAWEVPEDGFCYKGARMEVTSDA